MFFLPLLACCNHSFLNHVYGAIFPSSTCLPPFCITIPHISRVQVIAAEGEQKASRALRDASEVIAESSAALQLRYLQVSGRRLVWFHPLMEN